MTFSNFYKDESGAVTVDWVILTAAIVGIAIAVLTIIAGGINTSANSSNTQVASSSSVASLIGTPSNEVTTNQYGIPNTWELQYGADSDEHSG